MDYPWQSLLAAGWRGVEQCQAHVSVGRWEVGRLTHESVHYKQGVRVRNDGRQRDLERGDRARVEQQPRDDEIPARLR